MDTVTGRVRMSCVEPGRSEAYVVLRVEGHPGSVYVTGGTAATCDGQSASGIELAEWLVNHPCTVSFVTDPDRYGAVTTADFKSLEETTT